MGCAPSSEVEVVSNDYPRVIGDHHDHSRSAVLKREATLGNKSPLSIRRGSPLPPRISVTVPPDLDLMDVVPTTPIENPTLCGYVHVPPSIPITLSHGEDGDDRTYRLTLRGDRWMFDDSADSTEDQEAYIFDMFQYASKSTDLGTTVALVHRHSGRCIASSSAEGLAVVSDFPDWMSQDCDEVEVNPRFFLRCQDAPESVYTLFKCHTRPAKYLARDTETNKAYLTPWMRYPSHLQMKLITGHPNASESGDEQEN